MVGRQATAHAGPLADHGERGAVDATFGDDLGCRGQQDALGLFPALDLGPTGARRGRHLLNVQIRQVCSKQPTCYTII